MPDKQKQFQQIIDVSMEFAQAKDVDLLLEKILGSARRLSNADVGSIYIMEGDSRGQQLWYNGRPFKSCRNYQSH